MVISQLISECRRIIGASSETPMLDAKVIVKSALGIDDIRLVLDKYKEVDGALAESAAAMAKKRRNHVPIAYITGHREFMSLDFAVESGVLIPRPDTECIAEAVIENVSGGNILDIGTGSGAIAVSLAKYIPESTVTAIDISDKALEAARHNAQTNGISVEFIKADIFKFDTDRIFDCVVSNPPYIETGEISGLMRDVKDFEPITALDGGADGLIFYRKIADFCKTNLKPGGKIFLEHGFGQSKAVQDILIGNNFTNVEKIYDLAGIIRGCMAVLKG